MRSSDETLISRISPSLPIQELIKTIKHSFREYDYDEVQKILMDRENTMKMEMESLVRDRDSIKEELCLMERTQGLAELQNSKLQGKLKISNRKCQELNDRVVKLTEEKRVSSDREKKAKARFDKACEDNEKMVSQKDKIIADLNDKINEFNKKNLENELLLAESREKFQHWAAKVVKMEEEIRVLKDEKLTAHRTIDELKVGKLEVDKAAEMRKRFEDLEPRIIKVEEKLANILDVGVEDIPSIVDELDKFASREEGGDISSQNLRGQNDILGNGDTVNVTVMSPVVPEKGSFGKGDIIDLCDSDDERNPDKAAYISDICPNVGENETIERNCDMGSSISSTLKRKRSLFINDDDDDIILPMEQVHELESDDESCSDAAMNNLLEEIRSKTRVDEVSLL